MSPARYELGFIPHKTTFFMCTFNKTDRGCSSSCFGPNDRPPVYSAEPIRVDSELSSQTVIIIVGYHCYQLHAQVYRISFFQG
jgi:hypothetical protein